MTWGQALELSSYAVTVIGLPFAVWVFVAQQKKERENEEAEAYQLLSDAYIDFLEIVLGRITLYRRRFDEAAAHVDRAFALNPSDADVLAHGALCRAYLGDGTSGVELADKASRLNPVWSAVCAACIKITGGVPSVPASIGSATPKLLSPSPMIRTRSGLAIGESVTAP